MGSWVAAVGLPSLGLVAADELGVALERLVLVAAPERDGWGGVVAALVDGFDLVALQAGRGGVRPADARRLVARARERGSVLLQLGPGWPEGADLALQVTGARWEGLDDGHGHLQARKVQVTRRGRGEAAQPRRAELWLPGGGVEAVAAPRTAVPAAGRAPAAGGGPERRRGAHARGALRRLAHRGGGGGARRTGGRLSRQPGGGHLASGPGGGRGPSPAPAGGAVALPGPGGARPRPGPRRPGLRADRRHPRRADPSRGDHPPRPGGLPHPGTVALLRGRRALAAGPTPSSARRSKPGRGPGAGGGRRRPLRRRAGRPGRPPRARHPAGVHARLPGRPAPRLRWSGRRSSTCSAASGCARSGAWRPCPARRAGPLRPRASAAWRLASGLDERPPALAPPPADLTVSVELDPPADTVAPAAFLARGLAEELHQRLWARGSACTRVVIGAETEHGEHLERVWRAEGTLTAAAIADRLRWQLDGWIQGSARHRPTAGISRLWLTPDEVVPAGGRQLGFWGSDAATADRASRAVARVQGLLGVGSVAVPGVAGQPRPGHPDRPGGGGGRRPHRRAPRRPSRPRARPVARSPAPALTGPGPPARRRRGGRRGGPILGGERPRRPRTLPARSGSPEGWRAVASVAWAGPWPLEERWWDTARHFVAEPCPLVTADGQGHLAKLEAGAWRVDATYD